MSENESTTINGDQNKNEKQYEREAKANIKDWVNQTTTDENGFFAIHFACFYG